MEFIYVQRWSGKIIAWEVGQTSQYTFRKLGALIIDPVLTIFAYYFLILNLAAGVVSLFNVKYLNGCYLRLWPGIKFCIKI